MSIICHGGASGFLLKQLQEIEKKYPRNPTLNRLSQVYELGIKQAIERGQKLLNLNYPADDIVVEVISVLEDNELFNAGKGCCLTENGKIELDAIIVDWEKNYGAITLANNIKNPIQMAYCLKNKFGMKIIGGEGLKPWFEEFQIKTENDEYFKSSVKNIINHEIKNVLKNIKYSTVGCVVMDLEGRIAAGTSTGGIMNKLWGRIGDSPILGAGTYVEPLFGGISCTGTGERFIKECVAYDILARMKYQGVKMSESMREVFKGLPERSGGCIGIDKDGKSYAYFNSASMFYGYLENGKIYYGLEEKKY